MTSERDKLIKEFQDGNISLRKLTDLCFEDGYRSGFMEGEREDCDTETALAIWSGCHLRD